MEFKGTEAFIKDNFLLQNKTAERLYFDHAASMPIIDYHNHLPPDVIAANQPFSSINETLAGWRSLQVEGYAKPWRSRKVHHRKRGEQQRKI